MSESDGGPGRREVAYRLFAAEFDDADMDYSESDEERAPNYVVTPTGGRVNRLYVVGVLTEVESVSDDVLRGRVVDPTGAFVLYAGQYQQDERAFLDRADPPTFVAVTGKARTFQPEDSDRVFTSVRPESINEVDGETRDRWTVDAAEQTLERVEAMATAIALGADGDRLREALVARGIEEGLADGITLALDHYGTTPTYLSAVRTLALDAARVVAGETDEVEGLTASPGEAGDVTAADLLSEPIEPLASDEEPDEESSPVTEPADTTAKADTTASTVADSSVAGAASAEASSDRASTEATDAEPESPATETESTDTETETTDADPGSTDTMAQEADPSEPADQAGEADDEPTPASDADTDPDADGPGDFEPGEFDLDEDEREEIEDEYGTEFQSGTEVEEPGEANIDTPDPEEHVEGAEPSGESGAAASEVTETQSPGSAEDAPTDDATESPEAADEGDENEVDGVEAADLEDAVVSAMEDLDEGDGAEHSAVVAAVADQTGAAPDEVEDAIQDALMDGRCYEPDDSTLKPI